MYIFGSFYNQQDLEVKVEIITHHDETERVEIGTEESGIYFTDDPVEITSQVNDTFDVLLCSQASVRLLCRDFVPDFFCNSCREAVVRIYTPYNGENHYWFVGYIEPQAFSQGYNEVLDEVELTCIDCLAALQYSNYRGIGASGASYNVVKSKAQQRTFFDIIKEILRGVTDNTFPTLPIKVYYDGSKAIDPNDGYRYSIFENLSISELLFLGDEEDDVWTQEDVLTEMLKYLNLHIRQQGDCFYIFSWETVRNEMQTTYQDIIGSEEETDEGGYSEPVGNGIVADCDTQLDVCPTYNQLLLTDNVTEVDNVIESPLDSDSLILAGNYQKYMTEYVLEYKDFLSSSIRWCTMIKNEKAMVDEATTVDWFCWPKGVRNWNFQALSDKVINVYDTYPADGTNQQDILSKGLHGIGACVCAFGKIEKKKDDTQVVTSVSMDDYLVISILGWDGLRPTEENLQMACPVAEYVGNKSGGTFSPADSDTINYIVISGKMTLSPTMEHSAKYGDLSAWAAGDYGDFVGHSMKLVEKRDGKKCYYARKYWKAAKWSDEPTADADANERECYDILYPCTDNSKQNYEFRYSAVGKETDTIKKLGLVACMLIVGDKCVVEKPKGEDLGTGVPGTCEGDTEDYVWMKYKERSECQSDDEYYQQCFTLGIDPKLGDKILGTEFDIQKNAPYTKGITAEGTAIPIRMGDHVSGKVSFKILGPVNAEWNNVTRRHPTFFRHTKWYEDSVLLLQKTNAIFLKDFKVEVVSDNGKMGAVSDDKDIVYMSDTQESFVNKKDDLEFKITTALTSEECKAMGVNNAVKLSSPENRVTGNALLEMYDHNREEWAKPEQLYVDGYWREWHEPRVTLTQNLRGLFWDWFEHFEVPSIGKRFFVEAIDQNLTEGTSKVRMKETF